MSAIDEAVETVEERIHRERAEAIHDLREYLRECEAHDWLPLPGSDYGSAGVVVTKFHFGDGSRDEMVEHRRDVGGKWDKEADGSFFRLVRTFGAHGRVSLRLLADREKVCERVVVGSETVMVKDPEAVDAATADIPEVAVEREVVEWVCPETL